MFHELAHQVAYAPGDTTFNESFATAVERIGSQRWLEANASPEVRERQALTEAHRHDFHVLVRAWRAKLDAMYRSDLPDADKRARKAQLYAGMRADYEALKRDKWGGYAGYDRWFVKANNATLGAQAAYDDQVGAFERLFAAQGGDFDRFYGCGRSAMPRWPRTATPRRCRRPSSRPQQRRRPRRFLAENPARGDKHRWPTCTCTENTPWAWPARARSR